MSKLTMFPCFVLVIAAAGLAIPIPAQAQYGQQRAAVQQRVTEGSQTWGQDGGLYMMQRGRWVRTTYSRRFPDPRNYPSVFDIFENGRFVRRVGVSAPVTSQAPAARQLSGAETQLYQLIDELKRQQAIAAAQAAAGTGRPVPAGTEGTIGGFSLNTPNVNPLTVDSGRAHGWVWTYPIYSPLITVPRSRFTDTHTCGAVRRQT